MILHINKNLVFALKPVGVSSEKDMPELLKNALKEKGEKEEIYLLHRLDMAVGGIMVFARNKQTAGKLGDKIAKGEGIKKEYLAVVHGCPETPAGIMQDLLFKDSRINKSYVVKRERKGVKKASLEYEVISSKNGLSLVKILLHTGRTHQIRVQFSSRKMPLFGDGKYGGKDNAEIALYSYKITEEQSVTAPQPTGKPWDMFDAEISELYKFQKEG